MTAIEHECDERSPRRDRVKARVHFGVPQQVRRPTGSRLPINRHECLVPDARTCSASNAARSVPGVEDEDPITRGNLVGRQGFERDADVGERRCCDPRKRRFRGEKRLHDDGAVYTLGFQPRCDREHIVDATRKRPARIIVNPDEQCMRARGHRDGRLLLAVERRSSLYWARVTLSTQHPLGVDIYCAAGMDDLTATVELDDGSTREIVLIAGQVETQLPARPLHLRVNPPSAPSQTSVATREPPKHARPLHAAALFDTALEVVDGRIAIEIVWGCECHGELHVVELDPVESQAAHDHRDAQPAKKRFGSYEHIQCAAWIGYDGISDVAQPLPSPLAQPINFQTSLLQQTTATFGEIICLAGDFYAHLDDESAARFPNVWPSLTGVAGWLAGEDYRAARLLDEDGDVLRELLEAIHRDGVADTSALADAMHDAADVALGRRPTRRYLALASQNYCHFGSPDPARIRNEALELYRGYHDLALSRARTSGNDGDAFTLAVVTDAFACHFLTDLFASGHMRTPRRALGERFGVLRGSLNMSKQMHDEDNLYGLWCTVTATTNPRVVWRAFGDGQLLDARAAPHLRQVQEAVRRSVWEVHQAWAGRDVLPHERAEAIIPVPLPPGQGPLPSDVLPDGTPHPADAPGNHPPRFVLLPNAHVGERHGGITSGTYRDLEARDAPLARPFD